MSLSQQKLSDKDKDDICISYNQGIGVPTLAKQYNVSRTTLYQLLFKRKVEVRSLIPFTTGTPYRWPRTRPRTNFGTALEKILWRYGSDIRNFASRVDITFQQLYRIAVGHSGITIHFIYKIADELDVAQWELEELLEAAARDGYPKVPGKKEYKYELTNFGKALKQMLWDRGITKQELSILLGRTGVSFRGDAPKDELIGRIAYALELTEEERDRLFRAKGKDVMYG